MPTLPGLLILATPLILYAATVVGLRQTPTRSLHAAKFIRRYRSAQVAFGILILVAIAYGAIFPTRTDILAVGLVIASLVGAVFVQQKLLHTFAQVTRFYLDPSDWKAHKARGPHWRYEMQHVFLGDPEYVDSLILALVLESTTFAEFQRALQEERFPRDYNDVLDKRFWGPLFQTVRRLATEVVPTEVFASKGRYTSGRTPDAIFAELRALALTDISRYMDRWQYYWCLRNLNVIDLILRRTFCWQTQLAVIMGGAALFVFGASVEPDHLDHLAIPLGAAATGSIIWLLVVCGGASLLIVGAFRGTGTFVIASPCRGENFDPLWSSVIQVGIVSFSTSFLIYGIASPFLFAPDTLSHFQVGVRFVVYAGVSFLFCVSVFAGHVAGLHKLMQGSRENALARAADALHAAMTPTERQIHMDRFIDVRRLRVWPIRGTVVAQLSAGIVLPVVVQAVLLYTGLKAG